ncbi:MAG: response regulator [Gemmatimonadetes bacterium]|nr:MAG: response regulator [Gemmatimonadota bacterium]
MARILIIEDEAHTAEIYQEVLEPLGHEVVWAELGKVAQQEIQKTHFDCIILDAGLPDVDGFQLVEEIHAVRSDLPIIMVTGFQIAEQLIQLTQPDIFQYLRKPFELEKLVSLVDDALKQSPTS